MNCNNTMALITKLNTISNFCKVNRSLSIVNICFHDNKRHYITMQQQAPLFCIPMQSSSFKSGTQSVFKLFRRPTAEKLKEQDDIHEEYELIYRNTMDRYLLTGQLFSTVFAGVVCTALLLSENINTGAANVTWMGAAGTMDNEMLVYFTALIGLCAVIQLFISRMPLRIYYLAQQKSYIFVLYATLPFTKKRFTCKVKEVTKLEETGILPWKDSRYKIKEAHRVILVENFFRRPADLSIMLGYQKCDKEPS